MIHAYMYTHTHTHTHTHTTTQTTTTTHTHTHIHTHTHTHTCGLPLVVGDRPLLLDLLWLFCPDLVRLPCSGLGCGF